MIHLKIEEAKIENNKLLIEKVVLFDKATNETIRIAKINKNLLELFKVMEIDINKAMHIKNMKKTNPKLQLLIDTFDLASI